MQHTSHAVSLLIVLLMSSFACAETVVINYFDSGWYKPTGEHDPFNKNYLVGDFRGPNCALCGYPSSEFRNFFVFDLKNVAKPIESATLALFVEGASNRVPGFVSSDLGENYELHDVTTPIDVLRNGTNGVTTHADLGSGIVYGNRMMTVADKRHEVEIILNAAAIGAMNSTHVLFAIGGSITTLDGLANDEYVFAGSPNVTHELRLTLVPELSCVTLVILGACGVSRSWPRRLRK